MDLLNEWGGMIIKTFMIFGIMFFVGVILLALGYERGFDKMFEFSMCTFTVLISLETIKVLLKGLFRKGS